MQGDDKVKYKKNCAKRSFVLSKKTCSLTAHFSCGYPSNARETFPVYAPSLYKRTSPLCTFPLFILLKNSSLTYFSLEKSYVPKYSIFSAPILGTPDCSAPPLGLDPDSTCSISSSRFTKDAFETEAR